jgi:hypothetical protein
MHYVYRKNHIPNSSSKSNVLQKAVDGSYVGTVGELGSRGALGTTEDSAL